MSSKNDNPLKNIFPSLLCNLQFSIVTICNRNDEYLHHLKSSFMKPPVTTLHTHTTAVAAVADSNTLWCSRAGQPGRAGPGSRQGPANTLYKIAKANQTFSNPVNQDNHLFWMKNAFPS